jgi:hypothetical protein
MSAGNEKLPKLYNEFIENVALVSMKSLCLTVGTSAVELTTGLVEERTSLYIYNDDDNTDDLFLGFSSSVNATPGDPDFGIRIKPGQGFPFQIAEGDDLKVYGISTAANQYIVVSEGR